MEFIDRVRGSSGRVVGISIGSGLGICAGCES